MNTEYPYIDAAIKPSYKIGSKVKYWNASSNQPEFYHKDYVFEIVKIHRRGKREFFTIKDIDREEYVRGLWSYQIKSIEEFYFENALFKVGDEVLPKGEKEIFVVKRITNRHGEYYYTINNSTFFIFDIAENELKRA